MGLRADGDLFPLASSRTAEVSAVSRVPRSRVSLSRVLSSRVSSLSWMSRRARPPREPEPDAIVGAPSRRVPPVWRFGADRVWRRCWRPPRWTVALTLHLVGSALLVIAPRLPVAGPVGAGGPAFGLWPLLAVLALAPAATTVMLLLADQRPAALAVMGVTGALACGRIALDAALILGPAVADRPELWVAAGIGPVRAGPAGWLLVVGQASCTVAGLCAAAEAGRWRGEDGLDLGFGSVVDTRLGVARRALSVVIGSAALAGFGLLGAPFGSANPFVAARSALDAPPMVAVGALVLVAGLVLAAGVAASAPDHRVAVGGLAGCGLAVVAVALPRAAEGALAPRLAVTPGPVLALVGAAGLGVAARWVSVRNRSAPLPAPPAADADPTVDGPGPPAAQVRVGAGGVGVAATAVAALERTGLLANHAAVATGMRRVAGWLCALSGGCAVVAAYAPAVRLVDGAPQPRLPTAGMLLCAGLVLTVLGWTTAMGMLGRRLRPALVVVAMAMPMAAAEYVTAVLGVMEVPGVDAGVGWWLAVVALLCALLGALFGVLSGGFERDDLDVGDRPYTGPTAPAAAAAAVLAVPAYLLPLVNGAGRGVTGVFQQPFGLASWALLAALAVTVGIGLLGPRCRPVPACALFTGGCVLMVLRLARIPFGPRPLPAAGLAEGTWASVMCLALLLVAATVAVRVALADQHVRAASADEVAGGGGRFTAGLARGGGVGNPDDALGSAEPVSAARRRTGRE